MDTQNIINLLQSYWGIIACGLGFSVFALFQREQAKKIILSLMLRLEKEAEGLALQTGDEKLEFMLEKGYQLLPSSVRLFVPQATFNELAKSLYEKAKSYLIVQQAKPVVPETPLNSAVGTILPVVESESIQTDLNASTSVLETPTVVAPVENIQETVKQFTIQASQKAVNQVLEDITNAINNSVKPVE